MTVRHTEQLMGHGQGCLLTRRSEPEMTKPGSVSMKVSSLPSGLTNLSNCEVAPVESVMV
jgi:hypothetical protein